MRALAVSRDYYTSPCVFLQPNYSIFSSKFVTLSPQFSSSSSVTVTSLRHLLSQSRPVVPCSNTNSSLIDDDDSDCIDDDDYDDDDDDDEDDFSFVVEEDGIFIEIKKLGRNSRKIRSKIAINANLDTIWNLLTDYEKLADFIPGLAVSKLIDKKDNFARLYQIGQQNLAFGLKFNAKAVLDCFEKEMETLASGKRRDIEFKMTEGDFQLFEGKWSIEQVNKPISAESDSPVSQEFETILSYCVEVKPKLWLPVHLVEGRLCKEIQTNLSCIREEAQKVIQNTLPPQ